MLNDAHFRRNHTGIAGRQRYRGCGGVHEALYIGIVIMALAALWVWRSPLPVIIDFPGE